MRQSERSACAALETVERNCLHFESRYYLNELPGYARTKPRRGRSSGRRLRYVADVWIDKVMCSHATGSPVADTTASEVI